MTNKNSKNSFIKDFAIIGAEQGIDKIIQIAGAMIGESIFYKDNEKFISLKRLKEEAERLKKEMLEEQKKVTTNK